jgi:signal transduction histidine kinase
LASIASLAILLLPLQAPAAAERGSLEEAQAMVKNAIEFYKANGQKKALAEFSRLDGKFVDRDLYVTVYTQDGICLANINAKIIGKNMIDMRDGDGKYFVRERLEASKSQPSGWQEFKFFNPVSKKIEDKRQYWERFDNLVFATGAYKP